MKKVAVIIVNFNGWSDTIQCLSSLYYIDYENLEIIVVDNDSLDGSIKIIQQFFENVKIFHSTENIGFSGANNIGIRYALSNGFEYVWLLNNDTYVYPMSLKNLIEKFENTAKCGAVGSLLLDMSIPHQIQSYGGRLDLDLCTTSFIRRFEQEDPDYVTFASVLLAVDNIKNFKLFMDEEYFLYWEDVDYCQKLKAHGLRICVAEDSIVLHKESSTSKIYSSFTKYNYVLSNIKFAERWAAPRAIFLIYFRNTVKILLNLFFLRTIDSIAILKALLRIKYISK